MNDIQNHKIKKFFESNHLDLKRFPDDEVKEIFTRKPKYSVYDLREIKSEQARTEIKTILMNLLVTEKKLTQNAFDFVIRPLYRICLFIKENDTTSIYDLDEETINEFLNNNGIKVNRNLKRSITKLQEIELAEREKDLGLQKTIITWQDCNLDPVRLNNSTTQPPMDFSIITNKNNRDLLRAYIIYQIELTNNTYLSIVQTFNIIKIFLLTIDNINLTDINFELISTYINNLLEQKFTTHRKNTIIYVLNSFFDYLYSKKLIPTSFNLSSFKVKESKKYISNRIDDTTMEQIRTCLHKLENPYFLMYLIIYSTAMRVSEVCELPLSCLYKFTKYDKDFYALRYTSEKMHDKSVVNLISKELYELIDKYIKEERKSDSIYLFPSIKDKKKPFQTKEYSKKVKQFFKEQKITNANGTSYTYKAHSYRHELASTLIDDDVPIYIVQDVCHHQAIEMTLAYAEISKKHKKKKHLEYITNHGELDLMLKEECIGKDAQVLSNGLCANPLYDCHQINKCLECNFFRTDVSHLEQFKAYKKDLEEALVYYETNCYNNQAATAKKIIERVSVIINALENLDVKEE